MKPALLIFAALAISHAQITVMASPEPMIVTDSIPVRVIGMWDIRVCNENQEPARIPAEKIYMALAQLPLISASSARVVLANRRDKNKKAIAAMLLRYGLMIGTSLTAFGPVAASRNTVGALAFSGALAMDAEKQLEAGIPSIAPFIANLLDGAIEIPAHDCKTRTAFAAKMHAPRPVSAKVE